MSNSSRSGQLPEQVSRCWWAVSDPLMQAYHDTEWGVPLHGDRALFELLCLEGAQAGLSWSAILKRRAGYRRAFADFDIERVAALGEVEVASLLENREIVRNRQKIEATIGNAQRVLAVQREHGSFDRFIWSFVDGAPLQHAFDAPSQVPATTAESEAMSRALRARGFGFVGPTICYAFMQSAGLVNDHLTSCPAWARVSAAVSQP